jgi:hypothetical protein
MPAVALSRVAARVVESGPDGENLAAGAWRRLETLPDPRSPQGRIYPLACLIAVAVCAFTAAGNDRFTAVGQWIRRASQRLWQKHASTDRRDNGQRACGPLERTRRFLPWWRHLEDNWLLNAAELLLSVVIRADSVT